MEAYIVLLKGKKTKKKRKKERKKERKRKKPSAEFQLKKKLHDWQKYVIEKCNVPL
jgi:hypothetical protein